MLEQGDGLAIGQGSGTEVGIGGAGNLHAIEGVVVVDDELAVEGLMDIELGAIDVLLQCLTERGDGVLRQAVVRPAATMGNEGLNLFTMGCILAGR